MSFSPDGGFVRPATVVVVTIVVVVASGGTIDESDESDAEPPHADSKKVARPSRAARFTGGNVAALYGSRLT
jgi:hypothetical protein